MSSYWESIAKRKEIVNKKLSDIKRGKIEPNKQPAWIKRWQENYPKRIVGYKLRMLIDEIEEKQNKDKASSM